MSTATDKDIVHNSIFSSGFEFVEQRPLGFFEFNDDAEKNSIFNVKKLGIEANGKLIVKEHGFEPELDKDGNEYSKEVCVVSRAKMRRVLVFQDTEFCKELHDNVFVIPIQSLNRPVKDKFPNTDEYKKALEWYGDIQNRDEKYYNKYYFPKTLENGNIKDRVLILSDSRFVHKTMLYYVTRDEGLQPNELSEISVRLSKMLNIKEIEKCKGCKPNCDKCEYIYMFESVKKLIGRVERLEKNA